MKRIFTMAAALLFAAPAQASAEVSFVYHRQRLSLEGEPDCRSPTNVQIHVSDLGGNSCVDLTTWVPTATGGRVLVVWSRNHDGLPFHGAYMREVNCLTMEDRLRTAWAFTKADMSVAPRYVGWKKRGDVWSHLTTSTIWVSWEPIEHVMDEHKWICSKFRASSQ